MRLLREGIYVDSRASMAWAKDGSTPLHVAARSGSSEVVRVLLDSGANANGVQDDDLFDLENHPDDEGDLTPLHEAAYRGHIEIVHALLAAGALRSPMGFGERLGDPIPTCEDGMYTPLHFAVENGHTHVVRALLEGGADGNKLGGYFRKSPLHVAADCGQQGALEALIGAGADVNIRDDTGGSPLAYASNPGILETLLAAGADPDPQVSCEGGEWTPLGFLCLFTSLSSGSDIEQSVAMMELLLRSGADTSVTPRCDCIGREPYASLSGSLLFCAAQNGVPEVVSTLLTHELDPNHVEEDLGVSPVHAAARWGRDRALRVLLGAGGNVNARTKRRGSTPLHLACRFVKVESVCELLRWKPELTATEDEPGGIGAEPGDIIGAGVDEYRRLFLGEDAATPGGGGGGEGRRSAQAWIGRTAGPPAWRPEAVPRGEGRSSASIAGSLGRRAPASRLRVPSWLFDDGWPGGFSRCVKIERHLVGPLEVESPLRCWSSTG